MNKVKVGIIGTGFGAKVHAPMMKFHSGFEVVAIASVSRGNINEARQTSGIDNIYTDWKLMIENEPLDLVVIASAVNLHHEMVITAYQKGIDVLCEKPMSLNVNQSMEMITKRDEANKLGFINHEFRFLPARTKVKEIIDSGNLGELTHIRYICTYANFNSLISKTRGWLGNAQTGGGMLGAIGSHMTDSLHWWSNSSFNEVMANLPIHVPIYTDNEGNVETRTADDGFQIIGTLNNGATVTMELISSARQTANQWKLEIFGKKGTLVMLDDSKVYLSFGDEPLQETELETDLVPPKDLPATAARYYNGFNRMLDALYDTLETGSNHPYLASFENGLSTQKVLDAIRLSASEGRKVVIE